MRRYPYRVKAINIYRLSEWLTTRVVGGFDILIKTIRGLWTMSRGRIVAASVKVLVINRAYSGTDKHLFCAHFETAQLKGVRRSGYPLHLINVYLFTDVDFEAPGSNVLFSRCGCSGFFWIFLRLG